MILSCYLARLWPLLKLGSRSQAQVPVFVLYNPCGLEPGSSGTHRINGCARFGIRKTLKFKAFVPRTHRNASNMPASPFYSKTRALEPVDESRGARIGGGAAVAPCGARGGPGAAQARLPSHAVALHPPPVHPCVRPLREVPCRHGAERRRRASEARAWGAQPPALSGSDEWRQRRSRTAAARR